VNIGRWILPSHLLAPHQSRQSFIGHSEGVPKSVQFSAWLTEDRDRVGYHASDSKFPAAEGGCRIPGVPNLDHVFLRIVTSASGKSRLQDYGMTTPWWVDGLVSSLPLPVVYSPVDFFGLLAWLDRSSDLKCSSVPCNKRTIAFNDSMGDQGLAYPDRESHHHTGYWAWMHAGLPATDTPRRWRAHHCRAIEWRSKGLQRWVAAAYATKCRIKPGQPLANG